MKKHVYMILVLGFVLGGCSTEKRSKNDLSEMNLHGQVKSLRELSYEAIDKFGEIRKVSRTTNPTYFFEWDKYLMFNIKGNLIEKKLYKLDGCLESYWTYKFDNQGNKVEENSYNSNGFLIIKTIYKYDEKGHKIEENNYQSDSSFLNKTTYRYDDKGYLIEENIYKSDGCHMQSGTYKYDTKGNKIEQNAYYPDGSYIFKTINKYDDKGFITESIFYWLDGNGNKTTYKFAENGNLIEENLYDSEGTILKHQTYFYEYDEKNNWIRKIDFISEIPRYIVEREIEYYE